MKNKLPIIAILAVSSQLALAEAANDPDIHGAVAANDAAPVTGTATAGAQQAAQVATVPVNVKLPSLSNEVGDSLQSKLDAQMELQLVPGRSSQQEIASVH